MQSKPLAFIAVGVAAIAAAYAAPLPLPDYTYPAHICDRDLITTMIKSTLERSPTDRWNMGHVLYLHSAEEIARSKNELACRVDLRTSTTEHLPGVFRWVNENGHALIKFDWSGEAGS